MKMRIVAVAMRFAVALAACLGAHPASAQSFPTRPVSLVVPFPAGSTTDLVARILAEELGKALGQTVVVDNRGGGGGTIGTVAVARAVPDGYTLLMGTISTQSINPAVFDKINYDPIADFAPITQFGAAANVLVINPSLPVKNVKELIAYIRANPGKVNYASSGNATSNHLAGAMFTARNGLTAQHLPYRGGAQAITDLLRGEAHFMFYHYLPLFGHIKEGKLRAIAITSASRLDALPDVPTMKEGGMDDFEITSWFGVWAPAKTPADVVAKLNSTILRIANSPDVKKSMRAQGIDPVAGSPNDLLELNKKELARWSKAVADAGAKLSN